MATENVTVLFTDLVGSTALSSSLTQDASDELRREHFSILRQAVAESGGTEVKNLGDGLMVVFGATSAALGCTVAMQQGVDADNRSGDRTVGLRVGLSVGEVSKEEGADYFGDPVVEAARLCARCESGQILAAEVVRLMAGRRSRHECRPLGALELKGLPDPVETVEVAWEPLTATESSSAESVPLPGRLVFRPTVGVVGRDAEITTITEAFKRVAGSEGREVLLVSGEAGLGKTTLVAEATRTAFEDGACVLFGHCEEDLATPYQLFAEALGHYVTYAPEERLVTHGPELARLVPALRARIPDLAPSRASDSDTERFLLFAAVLGLLAEVSRERPVVVVLDDLHWADAASLALLRHLVAADPATRVLVIATYRDNELSHADALVETLAALRRQPGVSRIDLAGLDDTGVVAFMEAAAGQTLDDAGVGLAHALYRETDGNPFFVSEVLRHLSETGGIYQAETGRWAADVTLEDAGLPESVREVIGARVRRLGVDAGRLLSLAAVIGRDFDLDILARAAHASEDDLLDILDAAEAAALVHEASGGPGRYSFAHALIQHTLYEDLGATRRARAHRLVAEAVEDLCGDRPGTRVGELARHWMQASQPVDVLKAISYSRQAGDTALAALAPGDALRYYAQALDLYPRATDPDPVLALDVAIGLGTAQRQTGDPAFRDTLLDAAHRANDLDDTDRLAAAALALDRGIYSSAGAIDFDKVAVLEQALDRLRDDDPSRALVLSALCSELAMGSPLERRQALAVEAIAIAEAVGDDAVIVRVLNNVHAPLQIPPLLEQDLARTADALARAERLGDPILLYWAADNRASIASAAGDIAEYARCAQLTESLAEQIGQPFQQWYREVRRAFEALLAGDTDRAEQLATEALQIGTDGGQPDAMDLFGFQFLIVNLQRGTIGALAPLIEQQFAEMPDIDMVARTASLAQAYAEGHHTDQAAALLEQFTQADFDLTMDQTWCPATVLYADAAIAVGESKFAGPILDRLEPFAEQMASAGAVANLGPICYYLGGLATVLGRYDDADSYFARSAAMTARIGDKFFTARTDLLWGQMLAERNRPGDTARARDLLSKAQAAASAHGYAGVERRATQALQELD